MRVTRLLVAQMVSLALVSEQCSHTTPYESDASAPQPTSLAARGDAALSALESVFYGGKDGWKKCVPDLDCGVGDSDWGADSLTYALYFRWSLTQDPTLVPLLSALDAAGPTDGECALPGCRSWSDIPQWDSVAASREYEATADSGALARAKAAFDLVDQSDAFALGACPSIDYQAPSGGANHLKTLETDSNYVKAALLLYQDTQTPTYLAKARAKYSSIRQYFLDSTVPLYTVYVIDSGGACAQIARRFFGSVNGNMIWNGLALAAATADTSYRDDAIATASAVDHYLSDPSGIYEDLQAENDVVEPLVEAFYALATSAGQSFARDWILRNAAALVPDKETNGSYGRFWGGPAPDTTVTAWQTNGGFALAFAAAALAPTDVPAIVDIWKSSRWVDDDVRDLPATLSFTGSAIALVGTIGQECCESGHASVFVDGVETFDQTGIWQNKSSSGAVIANSVLFTWRWPESGSHTLRFEPGATNAKEGGSFLHLSGYDLVP